MFENANTFSLKIYISDILMILILLLKPPYTYLVLLGVKNPPANAWDLKHRFVPWLGKIPRRMAWQPTSGFLPGGSQGQRSLVSYSPWGRRAGHNWSNFTCRHTFRDAPNLFSHTCRMKLKNSCFISQGLILDGSRWKCDNISF